MAEFLEVMKQKKRMCKKYTGGGICQSINYDICPLKCHDLCSKPITLIDIDKIQEGEEIIMRWAAEHQEPVYPSIAKYLEQFGITIRRDGSLEADFFKANEPMSADTAKLLGISSEEGGNEKTD